MAEGRGGAGHPCLEEEVEDEEADADAGNGGFFAQRPFAAGAVGVVFSCWGSFSGRPVAGVALVGGDSALFAASGAEEEDEATPLTFFPPPPLKPPFLPTAVVVAADAASPFIRDVGLQLQEVTVPSSHLRTMLLPESSSMLLPAKQPNHATSS